MSKLVALATTIALTFIAPGEASDRVCGVSQGTQHFCHRQSDTGEVEFFVVDRKTKERFFIRVDCNEKHIQTLDRSSSWSNSDLQKAAAWTCKRYFGNSIKA